MPDLKQLVGGPTDAVQAAPSLPGEVFEAVINEDATADGQLVTCTVKSFDAQRATDPLPWMPYTNGAGVFFPKRGDRAKVSENGDGPGVVLAWWPAADASPDVSF